MKKTLITAVTLAACAATQLFAQNAKEGVITFALSLDQQSSISTSPIAPNAGLWSQGPQFYKSSMMKRSTMDVLQSIAYVLHRNAGYYSSKAQLVLAQGELGGFFNLGPTLSGDVETDLGNGRDNDGFGDTTAIASTIEDLGARLATGRHFRPNPINGLWPPGHHQPWGQIFVKDPGRVGFSLINPLCENVTFFFGITVQECYDCFFLNSFVTDTTFRYKSNVAAGPPCCNTPVDLTGNGRDRYYMTLTFDNTFNNPYLNVDNDAWVGLGIDSPWYRSSSLQWIQGAGTDGGIPGDGITPEGLRYDDVISSAQFRFNKYVMRFTLNGIVTYTWALKRINTSDIVLDFVGSANYPATGYGFVSLACSLITGTVGIAEKITKSLNCCLDLPWYDAKPIVGWVVGNSTGGWYGIGWNMFQDQYPINAAPGDALTDLWFTGAYFQSPINTPLDISMHLGYNEWNEARWQWPQNLFGYGDIPAQPESLVATPFSILSPFWDSPYTQTRIPSARDDTARGNTDWNPGKK